MNDEKNREPTSQDAPPEERYTPSSRSKRIAAWVGVILMVLLVIAYSYSIATGSFLLW